MNLKNEKGGGKRTQDISFFFFGHTALVLSVDVISASVSRLSQNPSRRSCHVYHHSPTNGPAAKLSSKSRAQKKHVFFLIQLVPDNWQQQVAYRAAAVIKRQRSKPFVRWQIRPSVRLSVSRSVRHTRVKFPRNRISGLNLNMKLCY